MSAQDHTYLVSPWMSFGDLLAEFVRTRVEFIRTGVDLSDGSAPSLQRHFNETKTIREIATGLEYLYSTGVVHGEMIANQVLLNDKGSAHICGFRLTKTPDHSNFCNIRISTEMMGVGRIRWQSPELFENGPKSSKELQNPSGRLRSQRAS